MNKRYQVFVSSTFADLREERSKVIQTLMEMDCIPAGMELFPAADEEQFQFIKRVVDDCDYYLVIIGGRYGSTTPDGVSYTEKEYDYAVERGLKVIGLLHENPDQIPLSKSEADPVVRERLATFRKRVATGRIVKFWNKLDDLPALVALSLNKTIKMYPAIGWVRADEVASVKLLAELNDLRKQSEELRRELDKIRSVPVPSIPNLAGLDDSITLKGKCHDQHVITTWSVSLTWRELFALVAPYLLEQLNEERVKGILERGLLERSSTSDFFSLNDQDFQTIKIQLLALGLIDIQSPRTTIGTMTLFWNLTIPGRDLLLQTCTVKAKAADT
jgi:hypothetical protein